MIISVYAIFCMNDALAITKNSASVTVSFSSTVESSDDAIDVLHKNGLITCKNFCKAFVKLRDKVISSPKLGGPYDSGVYYLNGKMGLEGMLITLKGDTNKSNETVSLTFPEGYTVPEIVNKERTQSISGTTSNTVLPDGAVRRISNPSSTLFLRTM